MSARVVNPTHLSDLAGRGLVTRAGSTTAAQERTLPLLPVFSVLVPQGTVQRGSVLACTGGAAWSLALGLAAGPSQQGAWVAAVGMPALGLAAAAETGVVLERLVSVAAATDESFADGDWADLLAACIDGFDVVLFGPATQQVRAGTARRVTARLQARGAVAITVGAPVFGADLRFDCVSSAWLGLGDGHGVAQGRMAEVTLSGRRVPQTRRAEFWLPSADGQVRAVGAPAAAPVVPLRRTG